MCNPLHHANNVICKTLYDNYPIVINIKANYNKANTVNVLGDRLIMTWACCIGWSAPSHELGHFLAATDEELFKPNLGLRTDVKITDRFTDKECDNELRTAAWTERLLPESAKDGKFSSLVGIGIRVFGYSLQDVSELYDSEEYSMESLLNEMNRKFALIKDRHQSKLSEIN